MCKKQTRDFLSDYIEKKLNVKLSEEMKQSQVSILDPENGIEPRELLMLVMELQKEKNMILEEEMVINHRMDYFDNLIKWVENNSSINNYMESISASQNNL